MVSEIYGSLDMRFFMSAWAILLCFTPPPPPPPPPTAWQLKRSKKGKKTTDISPLYTNLPKIMIIGYTIFQIWCAMDVIAISDFGQFFALLPP